MKRIYLLSTLLIVFSLSFIACKKKESDPDPKIALAQKLTGDWTLTGVTFNGSSTRTDLAAELTLAAKSGTFTGTVAEKSNTVTSTTNQSIFAGLNAFEVKVLSPTSLEFTKSLVGSSVTASYSEVAGGGKKTLTMTISGITNFDLVALSPARINSVSEAVLTFEMK